MTHDQTRTVDEAAASGLPASDRPDGPPGFELLEEIGRGGMGVVYRARDLALGRYVAIKVLRNRFPPDGPAAQRFLGEARITSQLQHPGIPGIHQVGSLPNGFPFLAMKLIKGQTLEDILKTRPAPASERGRLIAVFEAVCQALAYAHAHGVIHRDVKPANVMVGAFGEVQVMDWGLAKVLGADPVGLTDGAAGPGPMEALRRSATRGVARKTGPIPRRGFYWERRRTHRRSRWPARWTRWTSGPTCSASGPCWR